MTGRAKEARKMWTMPEKALLARLREAGLTWPAIAKGIPGTTPQSCAVMYSAIKQANKPSRWFGSRLQPQVAADRDQRLALSLVRADTTAILLGDPLPGRSALDQRGAAASDKPAALAPAKPTLYWGKLAEGAGEASSR